jgi:hypothetical protein
VTKTDPRSVAAAAAMSSGPIFAPPTSNERFAVSEARVSKAADMIFPRMYKTQSVQVRGAGTSQMMIRRAL